MNRHPMMRPPPSTEDPASTRAPDEITLRSPAKLVAATLAAWFVYLAADLWGNAVLFASFWQATAGYWRPPLEMFRLIPVGYLSFLVYCALLTWLLARLYGAALAVPAGIRFGAAVGFLSGASSVLGSFSVIRLPVAVLVYGPLWSMFLSALAGGTAAWVLKSERPWGRTLWTFLAALAAVILAFVTQNLFFTAPPTAP